MSRVDEKLKAVLEGYSNFMRKRKLAPLKHQSHLVWWVRESLLFASEHSDETFKQPLDLFLTVLGERAGIKPGQTQQGADAIRIYRYHYWGNSRKTEDKAGVSALLAVTRGCSIGCARSFDCATMQKAWKKLICIGRDAFSRIANRPGLRASLP